MSHAKVNIKNTKAIVISIDEFKQAVKTVQLLRKENISCILSSEKPGKSLEYANAYNIPYAVFIGKDEMTKGKLKLRDLISGEEKYLSEKQLVNKLS